MFLWYNRKNMKLAKILDDSNVKFSYKKLFEKLIDIEMNNTELMKKANVSKSIFYKIKNGENVTTDVLLRICNVLECDISEIVECVNDSSEGNIR